MYLDAVVTDSMMPVFNGTPEETKAWLKENFRHDYWVCIGETLKTIRAQEYLNS